MTPRMAFWDAYLSLVAFMSSLNKFLKWFIGFLSVFGTYNRRPLMLALATPDKKATTR